MNGFQCRVTNSTSSVALAQPKVARRCGADPANKKPLTVPGNCTYGAKQPLYWYQAEKNNVCSLFTLFLSSNSFVRCSKALTPRRFTTTCIISRMEPRTTYFKTRILAYLCQVLIKQLYQFWQFQGPSQRTLQSSAH